MTDRTSQLIDLWNGAWFAAVMVGLLVWVLVLWCVIAYRKRKNDNQLPVQLRYHVPLEIMYTIVPIIMVGVLFVFSTRATAEMNDVSGEADIEIEVYGKQWSWDFNYLSDDVYYSGDRISFIGNEVGAEETLPTLYLPVDETVEFTVKSRDVIHSFWIPAFLYKVDMMPGRVNTFEVTPQEEGIYSGKCAELCGEYHAEMVFNVAVVDRETYDAEMEGSAKPATPDRAATSTTGSTTCRRPAMATTDDQQRIIEGDFVPGLKPKKQSLGKLLVSWMTSTDHKTIGYMYLISAFAFFLIGGALALVIRAELWEPGMLCSRRNSTTSSSPRCFTEQSCCSCSERPLFTAFGNVLVPIQIGAPDVAFPRLNMFSFWLFSFGGLITIAGFLHPEGGRHRSGIGRRTCHYRRNAFSPELGGDLMDHGSSHDRLRHDLRFG